MKLEGSKEDYDRTKEVEKGYWVELRTKLRYVTMHFQWYQSCSFL
jgi:hypothetical protein